MSKVCFITGGNAGIGREAAVQIARKGFQVVIGCRDRLRGEKALAYIKDKSQSDAIRLVMVDMSLFESIRECSNILNTHFDHIDVLIHNAAIFDISQKKAVYTSEGHETVWMTNHMGPVYLTALLQGMIEKSGGGRIITVASKGLLAMPQLKVDLDDPEFRKKKFSVTKAYYQSKLAQIMFTYWLADKLKEKNISVNSIRVPAVKIDLTRHPDISALQKVAYNVKSRMAIEPYRMAETYTALATDDPSWNRVTGKYFDERCQMIRSGRYTKDIESIEQVMRLTNASIKRETDGK